MRTWIARSRWLSARAPGGLVDYLATIIVAIGAYPCAAAPAILITNLPPYGSTVNLSGIILGADPRVCRVAVFTYSGAAGWNTMPSCGAPLTVIQPDGSWRTDIATGGTDMNTTRVAALLVSANFSYPCLQGESRLSTNLLSQALARAIIRLPSPGQRWIKFSGYDWWVKSSPTPVGPGPNYWSDSTNNVWVDAVGRLHLRITNRSNQWQCAEVYSAKSFGHGCYRFRVGSRVDNFKEQVVLGLFTYSSDPVYNNREIDVEFARWGNPADSSNAQFVVQPGSATGHRMRFTVPAGQTDSTHLFTWETNRVVFRSLRGAYSPSPDPTNIIADWTFVFRGVPLAGDEIVPMNLWLSQGDPPTDTNEVEVIIQSFEFVPLDTPQPVSSPTNDSPRMDRSTSR